MKKATYIVTVKNGNTYKWTFEECKVNPEDYGNKRYIAYKMPSGDTFLIDCRYKPNYDFIKICVEFLLEWYGDNLDELSEEDEEEPKPEKSEADEEMDYLYKRFIDEEDLHHWSND